jgi:hypothetical protein
VEVSHLFQDRYLPIAETGVQLSNDGLRVAGEIQSARVTEIDQLAEPEQVRCLQSIG